MTRTSWHVALAMLAICQPNSAGTLRTVALTGHSAPGTPAGVDFTAFRHPPSLNNAGGTAFSASLAGPGVTEANDVGIWSEGHGQLVLVARSGDVAPGTPSGAYFALKHHYHFSIPVLNNAGEIAFYGHLAGRGVTRENSTGLWASREGRLVLVARSGSGRFSTVSGRFLNNWSLPALNDAGQTAFTADRAVWSEGSGRLDRVAKHSDPPAGTNGREPFMLLHPVPVLNNAGETAFCGELTDTLTRASDFGIWSERGGVLARVAKSQDLAPGTASGIRFGRDFSGLRLNDHGNTVFVANLSGRGITAKNDSGIWSDRSGNLSLVVREGDPAPGATDGATFTRFGYPSLNNESQIAFIADLCGNPVTELNDRGIWSDASGSLCMIAREGDPAPGDSDDVHFSEFRDRDRNLAFNRAGGIAFASRVSGRSVNSLNDEGVWATDPNGSLALVVREGDVLEVRPRDFRTLDRFELLQHPFKNKDHWFNDAGQVAIRAEFRDGSQGILVLNAAAILEPTAAPHFDSDRVADEDNAVTSAD